LRLAQECKELELPGYDADNERSANRGSSSAPDLADPIIAYLPHRSCAA
jgi:hypothetical protein